MQFFLNLHKFYQFFYRRCVRIALGQKIVDSTYAFKIFDRRKILALGLSSNICLADGAEHHNPSADVVALVVMNVPYKVAP